MHVSDLSLCNVEMWLQSYVATTTFSEHCRKGGGKRKRAEFSKVLQGF